MKAKEIYREMYFFDWNFSIVHTSTNNVIESLKFCIHLGTIHVEGTVSQISFYILVFIL